MKIHHWGYMFFLLGLIFAGFTVYFSFLPSTIWAKANGDIFTEAKVYSYKVYYTLALAILSSSCFIGASWLIRKK